MGRRRKAKAVASASALSQMGVCERLVVFEHLDGKHPTSAQQDALQRGLRAHRRFAAGSALSAGRSEPHVLRRFKDLPRRPTGPGQRLSLMYYRLPHFLSLCMRRSTTLHAAMVAALLVTLCLVVARLGTWSGVLAR